MSYFVQASLFIAHINHFFHFVFRKEKKKLRMQHINRSVSPPTTTYRWRSAFLCNIDTKRNRHYSNCNLWNCCQNL